MKHILADAFTFEVARAVDNHLSKKIGDDYSLNNENQRLAAVMFALNDAVLPYFQELFVLSQLLPNGSQITGDLFSRFFRFGCRNLGSLSIRSWSTRHIAPIKAIPRRGCRAA